VITQNARAAGARNRQSSNFLWALPCEQPAEIQFRAGKAGRRGPGITVAGREGPWRGNPPANLSEDDATDVTSVGLEIPFLFLFSATLGLVECRHRGRAGGDAILAEQSKDQPAAGGERSAKIVVPRPSRRAVGEPRSRGRASGRHGVELLEMRPRRLLPFSYCFALVVRVQPHSVA